MPPHDANGTPAPTALRFAGYVEPDEPGWDDLLEAARDQVCDRLLRARNPRARLALASKAAEVGLTVPVDPEGDFGDEAA